MSKKKTPILIVAAIVLIAAAMYRLLCTESPPATPATTPSAADVTPPAAQAETRREKPRPAARDTLDAAASAEAPVNKPQCTKNNDCRGPRTAECIRASCEYGKCRYNDSACECRTPADCEDSDPCTRNHCFLTTMKCIFIPEGCK